jgi:putative transcriptional regulator
MQPRALSRALEYWIYAVRRNARGTSVASAIEAMANPASEVAQLIRDWRRRAAVTQEGLAQALNVTFSTVSRWENGHVKPSKLAWRALHRLAAERGLPLGEPELTEPSS